MAVCLILYTFQQQVVAEIAKSTNTSVVNLARKHVLIGRRGAKPRHTHNWFIHQNTALSRPPPATAPIIVVVKIAQIFLPHPQTYSATVTV
jgi:hypothetical protein